VSIGNIFFLSSKARKLSGKGKSESATRIIDVIKMVKKVFKSSGRVTYRATGPYVKVR
jgi:hypothetical protein